MEFLEAPGVHSLRLQLSSRSRVPQSAGVSSGCARTRGCYAANRRISELRWADPKRAKERRGGLRVIYYFFASEQQIWLMTLYDKDETSDLTPKREGRFLKSAVADETGVKEDAIDEACIR